MLTIYEQYENYKSTMLKCNSQLLEKSNREIRYIIFEDLAIDVNSFVHANTLNLFLNEGLIDKDIY